MRLDRHRRDAVYSTNHESHPFRLLGMPLFAAILTAYLLKQVQPDAPLLKQIVPIPTGKNGYEDFLRAGDVIGEEGWGTYETWISYKTRHLRPNPNIDADAEAEVKPKLPYGVNEDMTELAIRRVGNSQFGDAIEFVKIGNEKPVFEPRSLVKFETTYHEYGRFKALEKFIVSRAHVEFADGNTLVAVKDVLTGLEFSAKMSNISILSNLVAVACQAIALAEFNEHLGQLSLGDAETVDRYCSNALLEKLNIEESLRRENQFYKANLDEMIDITSSFGKDSDGERVTAALKQLGPADRQQLKDRIAQAIDVKLLNSIELVNRPESAWFANIKSSEAQPTLGNLSVPAIANYLVAISEVGDHEFLRNYMKALAKGRIQLRLLQLHMKVIEYKWLNHQLPQKIEEFANGKLAIDPFTKENFHYELQDGSYKLYSLGVPGIGKLELKYHHQPGVQGADNLDPGTP